MKFIINIKAITYFKFGNIVHLIRINKMLRLNSVKVSVKLVLKYSGVYMAECRYLIYSYRYSSVESAFSIQFIEVPIYSPVPNALFKGADTLRIAIFFLQTRIAFQPIIWRVF